MYELRLIDKCINMDVYNMYQDIPKHSVGYDNFLFGVTYENYLEKMDYYIKD